MKAVYEMPKVSFEAFMANNAVAVCGNFVWDNVEDDDWDDFPGGNSVLSSAIGINGCSWNAGFADYSNFTKLDKNDNITDSQVTLYTDEHTNRNKNLTWKNQGRNQVVNVAEKLLNTFKGWLYFSEGEEEDDKKTYGTWGWSTVGGQLSYTKKDKLCDDAWLAPVFTSNGTSI